MMVEGYESSVHPGADAGMTDLGVDGIGEIDGRRVQGKGDDLAAWREDEDLVLLEVGLQVLHELGGVGGVLLPIEDPLQPVDVLGDAFLVRPMGRNPTLGPLVHLPSA